METMIENYINGNLTTARKQARRHSQLSIVNALVETGFSQAKAYAVALWLKTGEGFQSSCDIR